jgi:ATP-dependent RNA helicase RhlE
MPFSALGLSPSLVRAIADEGYETPTPIQSQAIPTVLAGHDLLATAQTGTGKTAAFSLPILQRLQTTRITSSGKSARLPRALILTPTRELAAQVSESMRTYGRYLSLRSTVVFGGVNINPQFVALRRGVDILVATPGRLLDHVGQGTVNLSKIEIFVLDEADRMLDMGFIPDIHRLLELLPKQRQNLLFSATFSGEVKKLAEDLLQQPERIQVTKTHNAPTELVNQRIHPVDRSRKPALLEHLVSTGGWRQTLVFTRTKHGANRLSQQLERAGINAAAIHSDKSQFQRTRALAAFKAGRLEVLVATDIASRGIDIEQLPQVINYELPQEPEAYLHRIGRTGRAGCLGEATSLVCAEELADLGRIQRLLGYALPSAAVSGFEPSWSMPLETVPTPGLQNRKYHRGHARKPAQPRRPVAASRRRPSQTRRRSAT